MNLAPFIDHTVLKNTTTINDIDKLCQEAVAYGFAAVCIPPYYVPEAKKRVEASRVKVATVIGFPFGYNDYKTKIKEAKQAVIDGAGELDMVMNIAAFKNNNLAYLEKEIKAMCKLTMECNQTLKVIIESGILSYEEVIACCNFYSQYPVDFLKTSTGFGGEGASVKAVQLMREHLPEHIQIKASGGIRDYAFAKELIDAGATRLGCSASIAILKGEPSHESY